MANARGGIDTVESLSPGTALGPTGSSANRQSTWGGEESPTVPDRGGRAPGRPHTTVRFGQSVRVHPTRPARQVLAGVAVVGLLGGIPLGAGGAGGAELGGDAPGATTPSSATTTSIDTPRATTPSRATTTSIGTPGATTPSSAATPLAPVAPPVDEAALRADQVAVVGARYTARIGADQARLGAARRTLAGDQADAASALRRAGEARAAMATAARRLTADRAALARAVQAQTAAGAALAADRARLSGIARDLYEGIPAPTATGAVVPGLGGTTTVLQGAQEDALAATLVSAATNSIDHDVDRDVAGVADTSHRDRKATTAVARDDRELAGDGQRATSAAGAAVTAQATVVGGAQAVAADQRSLTAAQATKTAAVAALTGRQAATVAAGDDSPSIMGPSALSAAELVAWFNGSGDVALTPAPIDQLARWYISEGTAEGVRGDLAFAQAVIETGGFTSPDATALNNYAGVGHCDSCASGWAFPSAQLGVRGQLQLLRTYAQPSLVTAQLGAPPAIPQVAPELQGRRGCCGTWQSLTGVWATDPIYGSVILNLYQQMLDYTRANPHP